MGSDADPMAVLDSHFRVRGVGGLRVVDASMYPRIPGAFPMVSTYMVAEKAADVILADLATGYMADQVAELRLDPDGMQCDAAIASD